MATAFDVRDYLEIPKDRPLELRVCHIASLWYEKVLNSNRRRYQLDTIDDLFPGLIIEVISDDGNTKEAWVDNQTKYIVAFKNNRGRVSPGEKNYEVIDIIRGLYGSASNVNLKGPTIDIKTRAAEELCDHKNPSKLTELRSYYAGLIEKLDPEQLDCFKTVFKSYIDTVMKDLGLDIYKDYKTEFFPFSTNSLVFVLNNYLSSEFNKGNYSDFFLWMNLGALLRNEIYILTNKYDSSFNVGNHSPEMPQENDVTHSIPKCLTRIPPLNHTVGLVGRDEIRKKILSMLKEKRCMALVSGLGGIGKTTVMQWICNDLKDDGNYVAWIDCGDCLKKDLLVLGDSLGITIEDPFISYNKIIYTIKEQLNSSLYLFIDNLTEELSQEELGDLNSLGVHIMVTSRKTNDAFPTIGLEELEDNSAVTMFFRYYNGDSDRSFEKAAHTIVTSVNRHTLLIELLAKAAKKSGGSLEDFNTKLEAEGIYDVFKRKIDTAHDGNETIENCVMRLYEVSALSDAQKHILKLFSIFTPEKEIYYKVSDWAGFDMDAMDELIDLGWIERSGPDNNYTIHQIIRDSLDLQMKKQGIELEIEKYGELLDNITDTDNYMPRDLEYKKIRERLTLTENIAEYLNTRIEGKMDIRLTTNILEHSSSFYLDEWLDYLGFQKEDVIRFYDYTQKNKGILSDATNLFINLANVLSNQGIYDRAIKYYGKGLIIGQFLFGPKNHDMVTPYNNLAGVLRALRHYKLSLNYYNEALVISMVSGNRSATQAIYNNMANVFNDIGFYSYALRYYWKARNNNSDIDNASILNNIATVYLNMGKNELALEFCEESLEIRERVLGKEHLDTATSYVIMAAVYSNLGNGAMALNYYRYALSIREQILGEEHPATLAIYFSLAGEYEKQRKYNTSLDYYGKVHTIYERIFGSKHPDTVKIYLYMAGVFREQGDFSKALEYTRTALEILKQAFGSEHPATAAAYNKIADVYKAKGDYVKASEYIDKTIAIYESLLEETLTDSAKDYIKSANTFIQQGDHINALKILLEGVSEHFVEPICFSDLPPLLYDRLSESLSRINTGSQRFHFLNSPTFSAKNS